MIFLVDELYIGQVMDCLVKSMSDDKRLVQLQCDKNKIRTKLVSSSWIKRFCYRCSNYSIMYTFLFFEISLSANLLFNVWDGRYWVKVLQDLIIVIFHYFTQASQLERVVFSHLLPGMLVKATVKEVRWIDLKASCWFQCKTLQDKDKINRLFSVCQKSCYM